MNACLNNSFLILKFSFAYLRRSSLRCPQVAMVETWRRRYRKYEKILKITQKVDWLKVAFSPSCNLLACLVSLHLPAPRPLTCSNRDADGRVDADESAGAGAGGSQRVCRRNLMFFHGARLWHSLQIQSGIGQVGAQAQAKETFLMWFSVVNFR